MFVFLIVLTIVVLIHELGHFLAAKKVGIKVHEFGFGYPPRAIGWFKNKKKQWKSIIGPKDIDSKVPGTIYSINWLPFGGFVRMFGEFEQDAIGSKSKQAFFNKNKKQKTLVILAGVFMNILLAIVAFSLYYSVSGIPEQVDYIVVENISPNSPAELAGFESGDRIISIDGQVATQVNDFANYLSTMGGQMVTIIVQRNGYNQTLKVTPRVNPPEGEGSVGVLVSNYDNIFYPIWQMPFRGTIIGAKETYAWTKMMFEGIGTIISGAIKGSPPEVTGPVGIYQITSKVADQGFWALIKFVGILSINLAVVNILPFPALDGGRFVFILLEGITGKKIKPKIEAYINMAGMLLLIGLMILITIGDITKIINK